MQFTFLRTPVGLDFIKKNCEEERFLLLLFTGWCSHGLIDIETRCQSPTHAVVLAVFFGDISILSSFYCERGGQQKDDYFNTEMGKKLRF